MGFPFCPLAKCPQDSQEEQQQTAGCQTTGRIAVHIAGVRGSSTCGVHLELFLQSDVTKSLEVCQALGSILLRAERGALHLPTFIWSLICDAIMTVLDASAVTVVTASSDVEITVPNTRQPVDILASLLRDR